MTAPRGGKTTVTPGELRRTNVILDEYTLRRLDSEVAILRQQGRNGSASRSAVIRRLVRQHLQPETKSS